MQGNTLKYKYRSEIDGIRAIAIIAVIINHFNKDLLPSGYLGVDIFFIISGYVITRSFDSKKGSNFFRFILDFYSRRVKRLLPSLITFVVITSLLISFFSFNPQTSLRTGISALFGLSNIYLIKQSTDYFALSNEFNVFSHTWSLGVEQQFYLFFPILVWFSGFNKKGKLDKNNLFITISILTIFSFIYYLYQNYFNASASYFLMPSRFWEIGMGSLLFLIEEKQSLTLRKLKKIPSSLNFLFIVLTFSLPQNFGIIKIIFIVFLTLSLIHSISKDSYFYKIITNKNITYIGLISYSLYLWHWGILSLSRWTIGIHWWSIPLQIFVIYVFSFATYELIENPIKNKTFSKKNWVIILKGIISSSIAALFIYLLESPLRSKLYLGQKSPINEKDNLLMKKLIDKNSCIYNFEKEYKIDWIFENCFYQNYKDSQTMYFLGDSHNISFAHGAEFIANKSKANLFSFSAGNVSFPSILYSNTKVNDPYLKKLNILYKKIEEEIITKSSKGDIVFIVMYMPGKFLRNNWYQKESSNLKNWISGLEKFVIKISKKGVNIIISTPTPEFEIAKLKRCKGQIPQWFNKINQVECNIPLNSFNSKNGKYYSLLKELNDISKRHNNLYLFNSLKTLCPKSECKYFSNGELLYRSSHHLSNYSSRYIIAPELMNFIKKNNLLINY